MLEVACCERLAHPLNTPGAKSLMRRTFMATGAISNGLQNAYPIAVTGPPDDNQLGR